MAESGIVVEIKDGATAVVELPRVSACGKCGACKSGCSDKLMLIEARNADGAVVGDTVNVSLDEKIFLKATFIIYGIPLVFMFVGFIVGFYIAPLLGMAMFKEVVAFILGMAFVVAAYKLIKKSEAARSVKGGYEPVAYKP